MLSEDLETQLRVQNFLFMEAELLDGRRFREWLELLTDDIDYKCPARQTLYSDAPDAGISSSPLEIFYFDEIKETLEARVAKLETNTAWAEVPPSRTRRLITNVRIKRDVGDEIEVHSAFYIYKSRLETSEDVYIGERRDLLRRDSDGFKIARRLIILDQAVLLVRNISIFL
jgi:biphenyl 2,3-dioxygenase beta subunit